MKQQPNVVLVIVGSSISMVCIYVCVYVCMLTRAYSNAAQDEPHAKQAKLDDSADLSGGLPSMLKSKITEVRVIFVHFMFVVDDSLDARDIYLQEGYVFISVCLFVCLFICKQDYTKTKLSAF